MDPGSAVAGQALKLMNFRNSAKVCREREAHHRQIAAEASLPNVRTIALTAATAWARQAEEAEEMESGRKASLSDEDAAIAREFQREDEFADHPSHLGASPTEQQGRS